MCTAVRYLMLLVAVLLTSCATEYQSLPIQSSLIGGDAVHVMIEPGVLGRKDPGWLNKQLNCVLALDGVITYSFVAGFQWVNFQHMSVYSTGYQTVIGVPSGNHHITLTIDGAVHDLGSLAIMPGAVLTIEDCGHICISTDR